MTNRQLTWQQISLVALAPCLLAATLLGFLPDTKPETQQIARSAFVVIVALITTVIILQVRRSRAPDIEPDFLALLVPEKQIMQVGDAHIWTTVRQVGGLVNILLLVQNVRAGAGSFRLKFTPWFCDGLLANEIPMAAAKIGPAALAAGWCTVPLMSEAQGQLTLALSGACKIRGRLVRQARRGAVDTGSVLSHMGGRETFAVILNVLPFDPADAISAGDPNDVQWNFDLIWQQGDPPTVESVAARIYQITEIAGAGQVVPVSE